MIQKPTYEELEKRIQELEQAESELKTAEKALRENEDKFKTIIENIEGGYYEVDIAGNFTFHNDSLCKILGYSKDELIGLNNRRYMEKENVKKVFKVFNRVYRTEQPYKAVVWELVRKDGSRCFVEASVALKRDSKGQPIGFHGIARDITERKQAEEALRKSEERFRLAFHTSPDSINLNRLDDGMYIDINEGFTSIMGYTRDDVIGKTSLSLNIWKNQEDRQLLVKGLKERGYVENLEAQFVGKDGKVRDGLMSARLVEINNENVILSITRDITDRKRAEQALAYQFDFQRVLGEIANEFISIPPAEIDAGITRALQAAGEFVEADRSYVIKFDFQAGTINNTHEWCKTNIEPQIDNLQDVPIEMFKWVIDQLVSLQVVHIPQVAELPPEASAAKEEFEAEGIRSLLLVPLVSEGKCVGTVGFDFVTQAKFCSEIEVRLLQMAGATLSNALDRMQAEESLRVSQERFLTVLDSIDATVYVADMETYEILFMNKNMVENFGRDMTGDICWDVFRREAGPCPHCTNDELIDENGKPTGVCVWQDKNPITGKWYINHDRAIEWTDGRLVRLQIATDITNYKKMEQQLQQTQKFEAIGTLAGGVAHDFNNLLMGIQGRASLMEDEVGGSQSLQDHISAIEEYVRSATHLTKQLLGFARGGKYEVRPFDFNELLLFSATMFGRTRKEVRIHTKIQASSLVIEADKGQIEQVLLNIFVNAWQAMPDGGDIFLETSVVDLDGEVTMLNQIEPGRYCKLSVTDTGIGIDEVTRQRIFDPFFTTKDKGRGTGLGLASAYGIVKNHGGMITVDSEPGHGTTFNIYLPASEKEADQDAAKEKKVMQGTETILLVDDEEMIIEVEQAMLEKLGYRVVAAIGGEQAIETMERSGKDIDLVILDLIMPGVDGGKVFDRIREIQPQVPVMLSSGYSINRQAAEIMNKGCNGFVQKPFNMSVLSKKIRQILDEAKGSTQK